LKLGTATSMVLGKARPLLLAKTDDDPCAVQLLNVANLDAPRLLWQETAGCGGPIAVSSNRLAHGDELGGLEIWRFDQGGPTDLAARSPDPLIEDFDVSAAGVAAAITVKRNLRDRCLVAGRRSAEAAPRRVEANARRVTVLGETAQVDPIGWDGLEVYELPASGTPRLVAIVDSTAEFGHTLRAAGTAVNAGRILDLADPMHPVVLDTLDLLSEGCYFVEDDLDCDQGEVLYAYVVKKSNRFHFGVAGIERGRFYPVYHDTIPTIVVNGIAIDVLRGELIVNEATDLFSVPYRGPDTGVRTVYPQPFGETYSPWWLTRHNGWLLASWLFNDPYYYAGPTHARVAAHRLGALDQIGWARDFPDARPLRRVPSGAAIIGSFGVWTIDLEPPDPGDPMTMGPCLD